MAESSSEIVVGIDFGTTYSGVSWAVNGGSKKIRLINNWPGTSQIATSDKVPTKISYLNGEPYNWGFKVGPKEDCFQWIKIHLEPDHKYAKTLEPAKVSRALLNKLGKTALEVVTDYLRFLWKYTLEDIKRRQGDDFASIYTLRVVLTVPAIWSHVAKDKTIQAARLAGLPSEIDLVTEPEAAALATFHDKVEDNELKVGDAFVVCDAGGGTVDLISYRIDSLNPLGVSECAIGDGDVCGSVFLDTAFKRYITTLVGELQWRGLKEQHKSKMLENFETIKRSFRTSDTQSYSVDLRGIKDDLRNNIDDETITIKVPVLRTIFDFVCLQIEELVRKQIAEVKEKGFGVKSVLLVGGFGESVYLYELLRNCHKSEGISVLQINGAWSSICRGATMWGLEHPRLPQDAPPMYTTSATVTSRLSRYSYGVVHSQVYDPSRHLPFEKVLDESTGREMAKNQMEWFLKRGSAIEEGSKIDRNYTYSVQAGFWTSQDFSFNQSLDYCDEAIPPTRKTKTVKPLCTLTWSIHSSSIWAYEKSYKHPRTKVKWRDVPITLSVVTGNANLTFSYAYRTLLSQSVEARYMDDVDSLSKSFSGTSIAGSAM